MTMNCPSESPIPPEAPFEHPEPLDPESTSPEYSRFMELVDQGLIWNPDSAPEGHLQAEEAIKLEIRGVTTQPRSIESKPKAKETQTEFWRSQTAHKFALAAKLRSVGATVEASKLENCHSYYTVAQCCGCNSVRKFPNRCDLFYCPECQPGLAYDRKKQVSWWTATLRQPKHVVLTVRNIPDLSPAHVSQLRKWFTALRRRKFCRNWIGGFYSIECTNEGKGWHLHLHTLIEAKWIDAAGLALVWDNVTNGMGRIVKVRDCRKDEYLAEVTKYVAKGAQLAAWPPEQALAFVRAFDGKRTFGVFGSLYGARTEFAEFVASVKAAKPKCDCGCTQARYFTEAEWTLQELGQNQPAATRPPPQFQQPELHPLNLDSWPD